MDNPWALCPLCSDPDEPDAPEECPLCDGAGILEHHPPGCPHCGREMIDGLRESYCDPCGLRQPKPESA